MFIQSSRSRRAAPDDVAQTCAARHSIAAIAPMTSPQTAIWTAKWPKQRRSDPARGEHRGERRRRDDRKPGPEQQPEEMLLLSAKESVGPHASDASRASDARGSGSRLARRRQRLHHRRVRAGAARARCAPASAAPEAAHPRARRRPRFRQRRECRRAPTCTSAIRVWPTRAQRIVSGIGQGTRADPPMACSSGATITMAS